MSASPISHNYNIKFVALFLFSLFCLVLSSKGALFVLPSYWGKEEYSHGYIVPFIAVLIGWHRLTEVRPIAVPSWHGLWFLAVSFLFSIFSQFSAFEALSIYSFVFMLVGLTLTFFGKRVTITLAPAFVYLFFAAPLPHFFFGILSIEMQLISTTLGVKILQLFDISVFQNGNVIDLGSMKLQVVEACNGLRYLFPLMSFGFLVAFLLDDKMWKRIFIFLSFIPLTIGMNSLRIAIIGLTVDRWGSAMAEGFIHIFEGYVVFLVCVVLLLCETWILMRIGPKGRFRYEYLGLARGPLFRERPALAPPAVAGFLLCAGFAIFLSFGPVKNRDEIVPPAPNFALFPRNLEGWHGKPASLSPDKLKTLDLSDYWLADYSKEGISSPVNFYIVYYESQRIRSNIHIPLNCILGEGWEVASRHAAEVKLTNTTIPVTRMIIRKDRETAVVYYWLDQRGRIINDQFHAKLYLFLDSIIMHRTDGALVRLTTSLLNSETEEDGEKRLQTFLESVYPTIRNYIPGKDLNNVTPTPEKG